VSISVCLAALLLAAVIDPAAAAVHPQGYVESNAGTNKVLCASELQNGALSSWGYIAVYADGCHSDCDVSPGQYQEFDAWVWMFPSGAGLMAAEYMVSFPASVVTISITTNPEIVVSLGNVTSGIGVAYATCQTGWIWSHRIRCLSLATAPVYIAPVPHPAVGTIDYASCELGYPQYDFHVLSYLYLYQSCVCAAALAPSQAYATSATLTNVTVESPTVIHAFFNMAAWCDPPSSARFLLRDQANLDTIRCAAALQQSNDYEYILTLKKPMTDGTTYVLKALQFYGCQGIVTDSEKGFLYLEPIATLIQSSSAGLSESGVELTWTLSTVDAGVAFFVSRSEDGADFVALDMAGLRRDGLVFTYTDSGVEAGKRYAYKVEYTLGGTSRLLFLSEEIRTPSAALALYQNRPNPFNPDRKSVV
jgi:hypothetical protein